jgi:DNA mismatch repair protein MutL
MSGGEAAFLLLTDDWRLPMPEIRQLPASVINKIAAGEVIERPASVVKELLENAVDAGATRIDVHIEGGGSELIRVVDNGCGISAEQLPLAVASHATSKIADADDLFSVRTLGFRGEALASISEVSQFLIRSRRSESSAGAELVVHGGGLNEVAPCGCPVGTTIEVRNLFFNTPVRRKFLRTTQTEMGHVSEAFTRIALANARTHFTLTHGKRLLFDLPPSETWRDRIAAFFDRDIVESLIPVEGRDDAITLTGYVADPKHTRANNRMQYLLLNGRFIRDRALQHALGEAYRGMLMVGRYPIAFLKLDIPAEMVDVNVHPTKLEVRFQDGGRLYSQLLGTLRTQFLATDMTARFGGAARGNQGDGDASARAHDQERTAKTREELTAWAKGELSRVREEMSGQDGGPSVEQTEIAFSSSTPPPTGLQITRLDRSWPAAGDRPAPHIDSEEPPRSTAGTPVDRGGASGDPSRAAAMQVQNRYIVTESDEGVLVIDQHALHERIIYEQLRQRVLGGAVETQKLLVPEPVHLAPAEAAAVLDAKELLGKIGIDVEPFGGDTVLVTGYPAMLANVGPADVLRQMVDHLMADGKDPERRDLLDDLLHTISCKAAIKAGDRLSGEEIGELIELRHLVQDAHHCPHGRPTALVFTREELDRRFKRV